MTKIKTWCLTIRIKKNDTLYGKRLYNVLLDFIMGAGVCRATVINGVDSFGRRGKSTWRIEGISVNYPLVIEVIGRTIKARPTSSPDKENGWRQWLGSDTGGLCTLITQFYWC
jgi:PII-like signaling protein